MIRISESEIERCIHRFNKQDIVMYLKGTVIAEVKIENARCVYNRAVRILEISNKQLKFEFNIDCLYRIGICTNEKLVIMFFDNGINLILEKEEKIG